LLDEEPDAAAALGDRVDSLERPPEAEWPEWSGTIRAAWQALSSDRHFGAMGGMGGIYYRAISQYAADHGIGGEDFTPFHAFVTALDAEYLAVEAERAKAEAQKRETQGANA